MWGEVRCNTVQKEIDNTEIRMRDKFNVQLQRLRFVIVNQFLGSVT